MPRACCRAEDESAYNDRIVLLLFLAIHNHALFATRASYVSHALAVGAEDESAHNDRIVLLLFLAIYNDPLLAACLSTVCHTPAVGAHLEGRFYGCGKINAIDKSLR